MVDSSLTNGNCVRINLRIDAIDTRLYGSTMVDFVDVNEITNICCTSIDLGTDCVIARLSNWGVTMNDAGTRYIANIYCTGIDLGTDCVIARLHSRGSVMPDFGNRCARQTANIGTIRSVETSTYCMISRLHCRGSIMPNFSDGRAG